MNPRPECQPVHDDLADLVAGDPTAIARHSDHLASCDDCRDARHEASELVGRIAYAGHDHVMPADLALRVLAAADAEAKPAPAPAPAPAPRQPAEVVAISDAKRPARTSRLWPVLGAAAALAAGTAGIYVATRDSGSPGVSAQVAGGPAGTVKAIERAAKDQAEGLLVRDGNAWRPVRANEQLPAGAEVRTDERTRASIELQDGTRFTLDHQTTLAFDPADPRRAALTAGRIVGDIVPVADRPASVSTPTGKVDVLGTRFALTATDRLTVVQVVRGSVMLATTAGTKDEVRAGEEGVIEGTTLAVNAAPGLAREVEWAELGGAKDTQAGAGLGALRAYKPGESRDRDWNLALANHDVKVRIVGPIARTEITETFRNDSDQTLEGVYQFPLPADAQIDGLALDVEGAPGGFEQGAFLDKDRAQKIWRGVIDKAAPKKLEIAQDEIIWVDGSWRDPALLDWKRGGRFELRIFPIPAKGSRTIKISYTQVVTPRGPWRQYVYPLPHSADGSTVADKLTVDVEVRGAAGGQVRTAGYELAKDPARTDVHAMKLEQAGFVPRGDLVVDYRAADGDAELRAWTFAGGFAVAPDEKLATKKNVGLDEKVLAAQRAIAADTRPTAVLALRPKLPRWREAKARDYMIVIDSSQSMVGERYTRAGELATRLVEQMDRRDRFSLMACDTECRAFGPLRTPSVGAAGELGPFLAAQPAAGASDLVAGIRSASAALPADGDRERWVLYIGDGFSSTGFRKASEIERAIAQQQGVHVTTIGIGTDADTATLAAAARGGGGSFLAWVPGQSVKSAAIASLESTFGTALRDARVELPAGLADVAPTVLPTVRGGEEVLVAARLTGEVSGDVVLKGTVGGQPFEQRYPLKLAVSTAPGNGFVPRLWASLAIDQLEKTTGSERERIVALSQGFGVMSKETSLLVLESPAMFDAFGVDRTVPAAKWTGQEAIEETVSMGSVPVAEPKDALRKAAPRAATRTKAPAMDKRADFGPGTGAGVAMGDIDNSIGGGYYDDRFAMRRTWVRVPSVTPYDTVAPSIAKAIGDAERALAKSPDSRERHRALVQALSYAGEVERANQLAAKWLDRDRLDPQALGYQADLLGRDGKRELALRMLAGVIDLDPDRPATHERMVQAYEHVGRLAQACSHRIALVAITPKDASLGAAAVRCLRSLGREGDAELVKRALADDATRAAVEKTLLAPAPATKAAKRDVVLDARWEGGEDLDVSIVTPEGTRVSWMGGRTDVHVTDATSTRQEQLVLESIKRGNYLIEIGRGGAQPSTTTLRGTIDVTVVGTKKSLPFELTGARKTVGRLSINLQERIESIGTRAFTVSFGNIPNPAARRVMLARSPSLQGCFTRFAPGESGRMILTVTVDPDGGTTTRASGGNAQAGRCVEQLLGSMHVEGTAAGTFRVPLTYVSNY